MRIPRDTYVDRLIKRKDNGLAKVITGIRRCGKSYLLYTLYRDYLIASGVPVDHIIGVDLDGIENRPLRDALALYQYVRARVVDGNPHYVFLDEIQYVDGFADVVNGLMRLGNVDVYVTGSNSRLLSTDVLTEFRGRGDEVRIRPLSLSEYAPAHGGSTMDAWKDFYTFGGLPLILSQPNDEMKANYLSAQLATVFPPTRPSWARSPRPPRRSRCAPRRCTPPRRPCRGAAKRCRPQGRHRTETCKARRDYRGMPTCCHPLRGPRGPGGRGASGYASCYRGSPRGAADGTRRGTGWRRAASQSLPPSRCA